MSEPKCADCGQPARWNEGQSWFCDRCRPSASTDTDKRITGDAQFAMSPANQDDGLVSAMKAIEAALLQVAENVAKHTIQRTGSHDPDDKCFRVDLREAQTNLVEIFKRQQSQIAELEAAQRKLQRFKDFVHSYLDQHGVPTHPPGVHGVHGCRIGDRLDWVLSCAKLTLPGTG